jgi:hypothetical protein
MIGMQNIGGGFRGSLEYITNHEKGYLIDKNMAGNTPRSLAAEFGRVRELRPNLKKAVYHVSLSVRTNEQINDHLWGEIARKYLKGMGFENNQYVVYKHTDTDHPHIHIVANRITYDGLVVSDSKNYQRSEGILRSLEKEFNLHQEIPSALTLERAPTAGELRKFERTGEISTKMLLQQELKVIVKESLTMSDFIEKCREREIGVIANIQAKERISGISYILDGEMMKGSDLGKAFTWKGLQEKMEVNYEQSRDFERIRQESIRAKEEHAQRQRVGENLRDNSLKYGEVDRGNEENLREIEHEHRRIDGAGQALSAGHNRGEGESEGDGRIYSRGAREYDKCHGGDIEGGIERDRQAKEMVHSQSDRDNDSSKSLNRIADRIRDISETREPLSGSNESTRRTGESIILDSRKIGAWEAIRKQVEGFGCNRFLIGIAASNNIKDIEYHNWTGQELLEKTPWLKRMNELRYDIYVRPEDSGLVMINSMTEQQLKQLKKDGYSPCVAIKTDENKYQAWVRISRGELEKKIQNIAGEAFNARYAMEIGSREEMGRLAGFVRRTQFESIDKNESGFMIRIREAVDKMAEKARELILNIKYMMGNELHGFELNKRIEKILKGNVERMATGHFKSSQAYYLTEAKAELKKDVTLKELEKMDVSSVKAMLDGQGRMNPNVLAFPDISREDLKSDLLHDYMNNLAKMDLKIINNMIEVGFSRAEIIDSLNEFSPRAGNKKDKDYARMIEQALGKMIEKKKDMSWEIDW